MGAFDRILNLFQNGEKPMNRTEMQAAMVKACRESLAAYGSEIGPGLTVRFSVDTISGAKIRNPQGEVVDFFSLPPKVRTKIIGDVLKDQDFGGFVYESGYANSGGSVGRVILEFQRKGPLELPLSPKENAEVNVVANLLEKQIKLIQDGRTETLSLRVTKDSTNKVDDQNIEISTLRILSAVAERLTGLGYNLNIQAFSFNSDHVVVSVEGKLDPVAYEEENKEKIKIFANFLEPIIRRLVQNLVDGILEFDADTFKALGLDKSLFTSENLTILNYLIRREGYPIIVSRVSNPESFQYKSAGDFSDLEVEIDSEVSLEQISNNLQEAQSGDERSNKARRDLLAKQLMDLNSGTLETISGISLKELVNLVALYERKLRRESQNQRRKLDVSYNEEQPVGLEYSLSFAN